MKWFFTTVLILVVGWITAVYVLNKDTASEGGSLLSRDSLQAKQSLLGADSVEAGPDGLDTLAKKSLPLPEGAIDTKNVQPQRLVDYAETFIGVPYLYGSTDPAKGFDCSGFITHVFGHFGIVVPRSSVDFTNVGKEVSAAGAKAGDLILFTGTDSTDRFVGHMGIVVSNTDTLRFIHSSSGRAHGVTITPLNKYYQGRYVKTVRVFP